MTEPLPLSLLNDFLYCNRRAALKVVEGWRSANEHTARGDIVHEHADLPGYESQISNLKSQITLLRALPVWSERLGLNGKCDIVEVHSKLVGDEVTRLTSPVPQPPAIRKSEPPHVGCYQTLVPVEFKLGKRRQFENDDVQLCAQALCLEEMFGVTIPRGAIFHAQSKRRREVEFSADLRSRTEQAVAELHALLPSSEISNLRFEIPALPPARYIEGRCEECSLFEICLPKITGKDGRAERMARQLFQI